MLNLRSSTKKRWLSQVDENLNAILIDHAHCEHKAAATAMSLLGSYITDDELTRQMRIIVDEELDHFHQVLELLKQRDIPFVLQRPGNYGKDLNKLVRKNDPERAVDRLLIAGLIEARSCERFSLLAEHVQDSELAEFYRSLFESEARHHTTYVKLAKHFQPARLVSERLKELADAEAQIIDVGSSLPRMHS